MAKFILAFLVFFLTSVCCFAEDVSCPKTNPLSAQDTTEWSKKCFYMKEGKMYIQPEFISSIYTGNLSRTKIRIIPDWEYVVVDKKGKVLYGGIHYGFDSDGAGGMHIYTENGKCGYFRTKTLEIATPALWDGCLPFYDKKAANVCINCEVKCVDGCHWREMVGGTTFAINKKGKYLKIN